MADDMMLQAKVEELAERDWDDSPYEVRIKKLAANGIPSKKLDLSNCQPMGSKFSIVFNDGWRNIFFCPEGYGGLRGC